MTEQLWCVQEQSGNGRWITISGILEGTRDIAIRKWCKLPLSNWPRTKLGLSKVRAVKCQVVDE